MNLSKVQELIEAGLYRDAANELYSFEREKIIDVDSVIKCLSPWAYSQMEHFIVISLDTHAAIIDVCEVARGSVDRVSVSPREVFRRALLQNATSIIVAHNHPSGHVEMSEEDLELTQALKNAGEVLGICVVDHIVFCADKHYSLLEGAEE